MEDKQQPSDEKRLFVGGISYNSTEDSLKAAFSAFGTVESVEIKVDKFTGRSKGFAFVEMSTGEEAQAAINGLNGQAIDGRQVTVNVARPKTERPMGGNRDGGRGMDRPQRNFNDEQPAAPAEDQAA